MAPASGSKTAPADGGPDEGLTIGSFCRVFGREISSALQEAWQGFCQGISEWRLFWAPATTLWRHYGSTCESLMRSSSRSDP